MKKLIFFFAFLFVAFELKTKIDLERPKSRPSHKLSRSQKMFRDFVDFYFAEDYGDQALTEKNETFIKNIISDLNMNEYCIEIRGMSYEGQTIFGHINAVAMIGFKFFSYIYVSEDWFDTLPEEEKQALIRHELMHIKKNHIVKKLGILFISSAGLAMLVSILNNKINKWAKKPLYTKEYHNKLDPSDSIPIHFFDIKRLYLAPKIQKFINFCISTIGGLLLNAKYSRMHEKEADIEACKTMLQNKQGFINFLTNFGDSREENKTSRFKIKQIIINLLKPLFSSHPTFDERIAYIKELS